MTQAELDQPPQVQRRHPQRQFPLTEAEWNQFMAVLAAMKPGLVADPRQEPDEDDDA
ncbi:MAG TPA: hypothetical protein VG455_03645 [Acidimicrobiales bacterium]|nr:hypothetical protein [Acidimicrobiales bacterium]